MRDDDARPRSRGCSAIAVVALGLFIVSPALAQTFHGVAELEYQSLDRARTVPTRDSWAKIIQMDYADRLPGAIEFSSSFRFVEQTVVHQPDRLRAPEGSVRLAHSNVGLSASYRPSESRDSRSFTTQQKDLTLRGYAQKPGLPSLSGSWIRSRLDPNSLSPGYANVTRSLSAQYAFPLVGIHAGYGDRLTEAFAGAKPRLTENHVNVGATSQARIGRAPVSMYYDFSQSRANASSDRSQLSRGNQAGASSSYPISSRTSSSLSYSYRRTESVGVSGSASEEHNGGLSLSHALNTAIQLSGGAGVRSAVFRGRTQTERFLAATASAQGEARPGWRLAASATHSVNWLPGAAARPADNLQTTTSMRLARGLDLRGDFTISTVRPVVLPPDTTVFPRQVAVQTGAGLTANPLRTVYLDANMSRSRAGASLMRGGTTSTSYSAGLRLTPSSAMQLNGRWGLTVAPASRGSTAQASLQWTIRSSLQASGSYSRSRQEVSVATSPSVSRQKSFSGSLTAALARELNASLRYSESNRGKPNRVRQMTINVVRTFGR